MVAVVGRFRCSCRLLHVLPACLPARLAACLPACLPEQAGQITFEPQDLSSLLLCSPLSCLPACLPACPACAGQDHCEAAGPGIKSLALRTYSCLTA